MENQHFPHTEPSSNLHKIGNGGKHFPKVGLDLGIIAFTVICIIMFGCTSSSRPSTPSEIAAQKRFQEKIDFAIHEYHQKIDFAVKKAEQKSDSYSYLSLSSSSGFSSLELATIEFQGKLNTAQEEYQHIVEAATEEAVQKSVLIKAANKSITKFEVKSIDKSK